MGPWFYCKPWQAKAKWGGEITPGGIVACGILIAMSSQQFAEWLKAELEKRGWLAARLARESGLSRGALSHIFSGERQPGMDMLRGIARAFSLPLMDVLRAAGLFDPGENPADESLEAWVRVYREADDETKQRLLRQARQMLDDDQEQ